MEFKMTEKDMMNLLEKLYAQSLDGIDKVSEPVEELARDHLAKYDSVDEAAQAFMQNQIKKCTVSGFVTGLGGLLTIPVTVPANIASVLYVQMRMIACLAYMGGYDVRSKEVKTLLYACLAGVSLNRIIKELGKKLGSQRVDKLLDKIPESSLPSISEKIYSQLAIKTGAKVGSGTLGKAIPFIGGIVNGALDYVETKALADRAHDMFIKHNFLLTGKDIVELDVPPEIKNM
ncbi:MAG: EcsC family protein [Selenomonadales bacterium]|jgi:hypothetical protein|nr:EcsC family protein [Selenomonadales bacterium]MBQ5746068.1 EcsC family protein [Selenomonadales bacterium]